MPLPRSHELWATRRRCAPPRSLSERRERQRRREKANQRRAKAVSDSWLKRRGEMPRNRQLQAMSLRRAKPRSLSERSGALASTRDGLPATSQGCFRQLAYEARRDAAQPQAAGDEATTRTSTHFEREEWSAGVETRWYTSDEPRLFPNSWLERRGNPRCRAATSCRR